MDEGHVASLALLLGVIDQIDHAPPYIEVDYTTRNRLTLQAIGEAAAAGVPVGIRLDPAEPEWPVVYFELPTGQVSWHLPQHEKPFDGHDARRKHERIRGFQERVERERVRAGARGPVLP